MKPNKSTTDWTNYLKLYPSCVQTGLMEIRTYCKTKTLDDRMCHCVVTRSIKQNACDYLATSVNALGIDLQAKYIFYIEPK